MYIIILISDKIKIFTEGIYIYIYMKVVDHKVKVICDHQ